MWLKSRKTKENFVKGKMQIKKKKEQMSCSFLLWTGVSNSMNAGLCWKIALADSSLQASLKTSHWCQIESCQQGWEISTPFSQIMCILLQVQFSPHLSCSSLAKRLHFFCRAFSIIDLKNTLPGHISLSHTSFQWPSTQLLWKCFFPPAQLCKVWVDVRKSTVPYCGGPRPGTMPSLCG